MPWLDGTWHDTNSVPFDITDRGLLLGDGLFDTSLVLKGTMVWREAHVARLVAAAESLGFTLDTSMLDAAIDAVLARTKQGSLRITVTRGVGPRGLAPPAKVDPTILATIAPLRAEVFFAPITLDVTAIRRNETSPAARIKSLAYLDAIMASRAAIAAGRDDCLFLNTQGRLACTGVGNVFALFGDQLRTPPLTDGVLDGIMRGVLLRTCDELGLEASERSLASSDLDAADEVFVTNSLRFVAPVRSIGRKATRATRPALIEAIIAHVARLVRDEAGLDPRMLLDR